MDNKKLKKVINGLECIISSGNTGMRDDCANCIYPGSGDCLAPALRDALALLKAQEPVEPTLRGGIGGYWYCGACNYQISRGDKFCRYCGQAVKWE